MVRLDLEESETGNVINLLDRPLLLKSISPTFLGKKEYEDKSPLRRFHVE